MGSGWSRLGGPSLTSKMDLCQWPEAVLLLVLVEPGLECRCHSSESSPSLLSCPRGHVELPGDGRGWREQGAWGGGREPGGRAGGQRVGSHEGPKEKAGEAVGPCVWREQTEQVGDSLCPGCWGAGSGAEQSTGPLAAGWPTRPGARSGVWSFLEFDELREDSGGSGGA